jgi:nicotinate phosphoribosyltransferase
VDRALAEGALFTDQYQFTMAQVYFRMGLHERPAHFEHIFRHYPDYGRHQAGYCINAGQAWLTEWLGSARFGDAELGALRAQRSPAGQRVFDDDFLGWLSSVGGFDALELSAIPEGRVVHSQVPLTVVTGPLALAQIVETPLLNLLNFQTLIATKASRIAEAAEDGQVLEFGLRRAPERGANAASRAALIGGAAFTSNVGLSHAVGLPPKGTHAHSLVQVFMALGEGELEAFRAYAEVYPDDCLLLVDTIDTLGSGVPNAITVFEELRARGHRPVGVRLDSGDLAHLAVESARLLDSAGFSDVAIVLSSELDELTIWQIRTQIASEARRAGLDADHVLGRLVYGAGTRLATSDGAPSLSGVYKLVALQASDDGDWRPALKLSDTPAKAGNPGVKRVWRVYDERKLATADVLALDSETLTPPLQVHHPSEPGVSRTLERLSDVEPLLEQVDLHDDIDEHEVIEAARTRRRADLDRLDEGVRRLVNPHVYHVSLTTQLWRLKEELVARARGGPANA